MAEQPGRKPIDGPDSVDDSDSTRGAATRDETASDEPTAEKKEDVQTDALVEDRFEATDN
jgi:hypothetical protein